MSLHPYPKGAPTGCQISISLGFCVPLIRDCLVLRLGNRAVQLDKISLYVTGINDSSRHPSPFFQWLCLGEIRPPSSWGWHADDCSAMIQAQGGHAWPLLAKIQQDLITTTSRAPNVARVGLTPRRAFNKLKPKNTTAVTAKLNSLFHTGNTKQGKVNCLSCTCSML
jgi:hypothetical protein